MINKKIGGRGKEKEIEKLTRTKMRYRTVRVGSEVGSFLMGCIKINLVRYGPRERLRVGSHILLLMRVLTASTCSSWKPNTVSKNNQRSNLNVLCFSIIANFMFSLPIITTTFSLKK